MEDADFKIEDAVKGYGIVLMSGWEGRKPELVHDLMHATGQDLAAIHRAVSNMPGLIPPLMPLEKAMDLARSLLRGGIDVAVAEVRESSDSRVAINTLDNEFSDLPSPTDDQIAERDAFNERAARYFADEFQSEGEKVQYENLVDAKRIPAAEFLWSIGFGFWVNDKFKDKLRFMLDGAHPVLGFQIAEIKVGRIFKKKIRTLVMLGHEDVRDSAAAATVVDLQAFLAGKGVDISEIQDIGFGLCKIKPGVPEENGKKFDLNYCSDGGERKDYVFNFQIIDAIWS